MLEIKLIVQTSVSLNSSSIVRQFNVRPNNRRVSMRTNEKHTEKERKKHQQEKKTQRHEIDRNKKKTQSITHVVIELRVYL